MLHLNANENSVSPLVRRVYSSSLAERYLMGLDESGVAERGGSFAAKAMREVADIIAHAERLACLSLHGNRTLLSCISGVHAMTCVLLGLSAPSDAVMTIPSRYGGHFSAKAIIEMTGRRHVYASFLPTGTCLDLSKVADEIDRHSVRLIYLDCSVMLEPIDLKLLKAHVPSNVKIVFDASHTLGLIMGGQFCAPLLEGADAVSANTHKTFPGPHRGLICFRDEELAQRVEATCSALTSSIHTNSLLALAAAIIEHDPYRQAYAAAVVQNANVLGTSLMSQGLRVRQLADGCFSRCHQVHLFVPGQRAEVIRRFLDSDIALTTSRAFETDLYVRLGVQEITRFGMGPPQMELIARLIARCLMGENVGQEARALVASHRDTEFYTGEYPARL